MNYSIEEGNIIFNCAQYRGSLPFSISPKAIGQSQLADEDARLFILRSPYYKAAVDRFGISLDQRGKVTSLGYLFPVSLLDQANDQEYAEMKEWQQDMLYIGYRLLLDYCHENNKLFVNGNVVETLDDIKIGDDVFLLVYDGKVEKDEARIIPALYDKGFYLTGNPFERTRLYRSSYMRRIIDGDVRHKDLILKEATESFVKFGFIKDLYVNLMPYVQNGAFRYILLYQVIEYLMDLKKNETWFDSMNKFSAKHSNELIHRLLDTGKEESLINMVFAGVKRGDNVYLEFISYAKQLYDGVNKDRERNDDFPAYMYGARNVLVHNLKEAIDFKAIIDELAERYEKIICMLIMSVRIDECVGKGVFVYDINQKYKENVKAFSKLFHEG